MPKIGDRIELIKMVDDPSPIEPDTKGTIDYLSEMPDFQQIGVKWDNGRTLSLICPPDQYRELNAADPDGLWPLQIG